MIALGVALAFLSGVLLGWMVRPAPQRFLRWSRGPVPYWRADAVAEQVALNLALLRPTRQEAGELVAAARLVRVVFVPRAFQAHAPEKAGLDGFAVWARIIYVQAGKGWERRLAEAISQHLRLKILGEVDRHGADTIWRDTALRGFDVPDQDGDHPASDRAGELREVGDAPRTRQGARRG